jgi:hypothetical protein
MTELAKNRSDAIRHLWKKHPDLTASEVAKAVNSRNPQYGYQNLRDLANVIRHRDRSREESLSSDQSDCSSDLRGVVKRGVKRSGVVHCFVYGPRVMPAGLAAAVVAAARAGGLDWRVVNERNGMLHCKIPGTKYGMIAYESAGTLTVYAGHGLPDFEDLSLNVLVALDGVIRKYSTNADDPVVLEAELHQMDVFLDRLWRYPSYHLPLTVKGIERIGPFSIRIKQGMAVRRIRHDGTDLTCLELEVKPPVEAEVQAAIEANNQRLPEIVTASVAEAMKSFGSGFGSEFGKQFGDAFAQKFKEMFGVTDQPAQLSSPTADGRRYT